MGHRCRAGSVFSLISHEPSPHNRKKYWQRKACWGGAQVCSWMSALARRSDIRGASGGFLLEAGAGGRLDPSWIQASRKTHVKAQMRGGVFFSPGRGGVRVPPPGSALDGNPHQDLTGGMNASGSKASNYTCQATNFILWN